MCCFSFFKRIWFYFLRIKYLIGLLFYGISVIGFSQQTDLNFKNSKPEDITYTELKKLLSIAVDNADSINIKIYTNFYLNKAKAENNNLEIARAYYYYITWDDFKNDLLYCDSIIEITKNSEHFTYPATGYLFRANVYYNASYFQKALDDFIKVYALAREKGDSEREIEALLGIAAIKNVWGLEEEALDIYRKQYEDIISQEDYQTKSYEDYILFATNLSLSYIRNQQPDSALAIASKAMKLANRMDDEFAYQDLVKQHATANFYLENHSKALDTLKKYQEQYSGLMLSDAYYMMGKIYEERGDKRSSLIYFKNVDSLHRILNDPFPELKEVYNELFKEAKKDGKQELQLYYIGQLLEVDSILDARYTNINKRVRSNFDIPKMKEEQSLLQSKLDSRRILLLGSAVLLLLCIALIVYFFKRQQGFKVRLDELLHAESIEPKIKKGDNHSNDGLVISKEIVTEVLNKLAHFEASKDYLSKDITLASLAKEFNTNSSYLSQIINHNKQVNFSSYLKELRIANAINVIKKDHQFLKYSINGLADEFGFTTAESFSKAFREKTGIKPSYFLDELRKTYQ